MIIYIATFPRAGNTLCRNLIGHYFDYTSSSVYADDVKLFNKFEIDTDERLRWATHHNRTPYRVINHDCLRLLTEGFRRELAQSSEIFFLKTHEYPYETYMEGEFIFRVLRHPGAALWSYTNFIRDFEKVKDVTVEQVIPGTWVSWSEHCNRWREVQTRVPHQCFTIKYEDLVQNENLLLTKIQEWTKLPLKQPAGSFPTFEYWHQISPRFYRSGKNDEWKDKLTPQALILLYQYHGETMIQEGYTIDFAPVPDTLDAASWQHLAALGLPAHEILPVVTNAGEIVQAGAQRYQIMFNGVKIPADCQTPATSELIQQCGGHYQPQQEYIFNEVIKRLPDDAVMLELGCEWPFYSVWFLTHSRNRRAILVDASPENAAVALGTLALNQCSANFELGSIGDNPAKPSYLGNTQKPNFVPPPIHVDALMRKYGVTHLHLLRSDIQGAEVAGLDEAAATLKNQAIDYVFIATHSNDCHRLCVEKLTLMNYHILAEANLFESYSRDGWIMACSDQVQDKDALPIRKRNVSEWTWAEAVEAWANQSAYQTQHPPMIQGRELREAYTQLQQEHHQLAQQFFQVTTENAHRLALNQQLHQQINQLQEQLAQVTAENIHHRTDNAELQQQLDQMTAENAYRLILNEQSYQQFVQLQERLFKIKLLLQHFRK